MKTLKSIAIALTFVCSGFAFADSNPKEKESYNSIGQEVAHLLSSPDVDLTYDQEAVLKFYINNDNEIVIRYVDSKDFRLRRFVEQRLNHKKVSEDFVSA